MKDNYKNYIGRYYRVLSTEPGETEIICLPAPNSEHLKTAIPVNSVVKIVSHDYLFDANWFVVELGFDKFLVTKTIVDKYFFGIKLK